MSDIHFKETVHGFEYGSATVTRLFSDKDTKAVTVEVKTAKGDIQVYVTKTGKIRVFGRSDEWLPEVKPT